MVLRAMMWALVLAAAAGAQLRTKHEINTETPEGALMQHIGQEQDPAKKMTLLEDFAAKHGSHAGLPWVLGQMIPAYVKAGQNDKAIAAADKLIALDPADAEMAHQALKAAEAKGDPDLVLQWARKTADAAKKAAAIPKPSDEEQAEHWKYRVDFATQVQKYCEYSLYAQSLKTADPAKKVAVMDGLTQLNPKSEYAPQLGDQYFLAYRQLNDMPKATAVAEKMAAEGKANEDMLLVAASQAMTAKDQAKVLDYSQKLVALMQTKPAPAGVAAEDWQKRKNTMLGYGHYMQGVTLSNQSKYALADKSLREALPLIENEQVKAETLFHLGQANFRMGEGAKDGTANLREGMKFFQQCAAIKSPFQATAQKNVAVMKTKYRGL